MSKNYLYLAAIISVFTFALPASAQTSTPATPRTRIAHVKQEPCWQQAGISKDVIDQRDSIQRDAHSQVASVCADSTLTPQQKKEKIQLIHQDTKQKLEGLISADDQQKLDACRKERAGNNPAPVATKHPGAGPCGELPSANGGASGAESH